MKPRIQFSVEEDLPDFGRQRLIEEIGSISGAERVVQVNPSARSSWGRSLYVLVMSDDATAEKAAEAIRSLNGIVAADVDKHRLKAPAALERGGS